MDIYRISLKNEQQNRIRLSTERVDVQIRVSDITANFGNYRDCSDQR